MTTNITPVSQHDGATLSRNVDGEDAYMDGGSAPLGTVLQKLADRAEFAKDATAFSRPAWSESLHVASGGSNSSFTVGIGAISHVQTYRSGTTTHKVYAYAGGTIGASKIEGGGNLANSTWYYVYAYDNAGSLDFEISTTVPSANLCIKSGDSTRVYLGCFRTLSTGAPVPMRMARGRYVYRIGAMDATADLLVLNGLSDTSYTAVDCSSFIPPHAKLGTFRAKLVSTTGSARNYVYFQTYGDANTDMIEMHVPGTNGDSSNAVFDLEVDSSRRLQYKVTNNTAAPDMYAWVHGFYE